MGRDITVKFILGPLGVSQSIGDSDSKAKIKFKKGRGSE